MGIGVVFGQRSQLNWDLPMEDTFELYQKMYRIPNAAFKRNVEFFVELLDMRDFLRKPVRQLSLGQKMRAEIAVALLHDPKILYLDEPTIGLDVVVKEKIRKFIRQLRDEKNTTVILTTHDMDDIDQICDRIVIIDKGKKLVDESLEGFKQRYNEEYYMEVTFGGEIPEEVSAQFTLMGRVRNSATYRFVRSEIVVREAMRYFANNFDIADITMRNASLEEIVRKLY
jgi:ABC-2 type transport system ATP-binding protein